MRTSSVLSRPRLSLAAVVVFATGGLLLTGCTRRGAAPPPAALARTTERPPVPVTVAPVALRQVQRTVTMVGTLHGEEEITITPKVEGRVLKIHHDLGDVVRPGEPLLEIDPLDYKLSLAETQKALELELARLGLDALPPGKLDVDRLPAVVRARSVEENAQRRLDRTTGLRESAAVAQQELDEVRAQHREARAAREQVVMEAEATLASARYKHAQLETAQQRSRDTQVVVPSPSARERGGGEVEYVVAQRMVSEGEMVRAFPSVAVFRLVMDQVLKLVATVPERHVGEVRVGQMVEVRVEAYPQEVFQGVVARLNPTVDPVNRTFQVEARIPNAERKLKAGGFTKAEILTRVDPQARTVPLEALVTFAGVNKVFEIREGRAHQVAVQPGVRGRGWVEVLGDLPAEAVVATSGQSQLVEGSEVRVREATPQPEKMSRR